MSTLRLVSHNVFWGQGAPFDTDQPGPVRSDIVNQLTELLLESNPDVLCLQEVQSASTFSSWSATMEAARFSVSFPAPSRMQRRLSPGLNGCGS